MGLWRRHDGPVQTHDAGIMTLLKSFWGVCCPDIVHYACKWLRFDGSAMMLSTGGAGAGQIETVDALVIRARREHIYDGTAQSARAQD